MVFTRRIYDLEEVIASFLLSLRKQRIEEALFWLEELEFSYEEDEIKNSILQAWAICKGVIWWNFLQTWADNKNTILGRRALVKEYCNHDRSQKDSSIWISYCSREWQSYRNIISDKYIVSDDLQDTQLKLCINCWLNRLNPSLKCIPLHYDEWDLQEEDDKLLFKMRSSRKFSIPYDCHLGITKRGFNADTTNGIHSVHLYTLLANPLWATLLEPYLTEENEWNSDQDHEDFYTSYFGKEDIPDEWPLKEQQKSHGNPPSKRSAYNLKQWWSSWVSENHLYIFGRQLCEFHSWMNAQNLKENVFDFFERWNIEYSNSNSNTNTLKKEAYTVKKFIYN